MKKYLLGLLKHIFNKKISILAQIDNVSKLSNKAKINRFAKMYNSSLGEYSIVGSNTQIVNADIGKFCSVSWGISIGLAAHPLKNISSSPIFVSKYNGTETSWTNKNTFVQDSRVTIGNDVWIGAKAIIVSGVKIGDGAVIGAGAIVTKDLPDYAIAVGVPAKIIKYRFSEDVVKKLQEIKWWNLSDDVLKKNIELFQKSDFTVSDLERIQK